MLRQKEALSYISHTLGVNSMSFLVPVSNCDLIDSDMDRVVVYIIDKKKTQILDLSGNRITQMGISIIAKALRTDSVRENQVSSEYTK